MARVAVVTGGTRGIGANRRDSRSVARRQSHDSEEDQLAEWIVGGRGDFLIRQIHDSQRHQRACTSADVFLRELA
jgi:hypothetical protein